MSGWSASGGGESGAGAGAWLRGRPVEVVVTDDDGAELVVPIVDLTDEALRAMLAAATAIAVVCALVILAVRRIRGV